MSDEKNLRDQFHILFDDFDDFEKTAEKAEETVTEAAESIEEAVENVQETAAEKVQEIEQTAAEALDNTARQAAGLVDDTDIRNEKIYDEINFEDLSTVISGHGEDEPAAITDAVKQATQTAVEAHSEIDHTFSDDLEDFDDLDELDDDFAELSKSLEESFEDSGVSEEVIPAIETAAAEVLPREDGADFEFEELSDETEDDDEDADDDDDDDDDDEDDEDDDDEDDEFDDEEDIIPVRRSHRTSEPTAEDLKKESRNFWIFTAVVALLVAAAILFILWRRGIIFNEPTETPAPSTTAEVTTEEITTAPETSTEEVTTEEVTTEEATTEEVTTEEATEDPAEEVILHYSNLFVVKADEANSLYVRNAASAEGRVIGILYGFAGGEIISEEGDWYQISSGSVTGYVAKSFVESGDAAKELAKAHTSLHAKVTADTLNVRSAPDTSDDGNIINTVLKGASLPYLETEGDFYKITDPNGNAGYVSTAYSDLGYYLDEAVPYTQP